MRDNGPNGWCWDTEAHVKNITLYMKSSGLFALGYNRVNIVRFEANHTCAPQPLPLKNKP
jgi:hypothetical protein